MAPVGTQIELIHWVEHNKDTEQITRQQRQQQTMRMKINAAQIQMAAADATTTI